MLENLDEASDLEVWEFAKANHFTIVTKDSDFNDLAILKGVPPKVIWLKMGNCRVLDMERVLIVNENSIKYFLNTQNSAILEI